MKNHATSNPKKQKPTNTANEDTETREKQSCFSLRSFEIGLTQASRLHRPSVFA